MTEIYFTLALAVSALLITIHFGIIALSYMTSKVLSNSSLEGFSKHELNQAFYSLFILGSIFAAMLVANNLFCLSLVGTGYTNACLSPQGFSFEGMNGALHLSVAREKMSMFYNDVRVLGKGALRAYDWADYFGDSSGGAGLISFKGIPFMGHASVHAGIYSECFDILSHVLFFVKFQELFLIINSVYFFPPLLYFGLVLRILPFTRKLGGLLLGISIATFYVLPYFYIAGWIIVESAPSFGTKYIVDTSAFVLPFMSFNVMGNDGVTEPIDMSKYIDELLYDQEKLNQEKIKVRDISMYGIQAVQDAGLIEDDLTISVPTDAEGVVHGMGLVQGKYVDSKNLYGDSRDYLMFREGGRNNSFVNIVARVVLSTIFITLFAVVGTISAIKEISVLFGGDVEIAGLTRLI